MGSGRAARAIFTKSCSRRLKEVGRPVFFSLLVIAVAFLPVFTLEDQEGRLFKPLAYTKNFAMAIAAVLAITLDPALRMLFTRMKNYKFRPRWLAGIANAVAGRQDLPEEQHPISSVSVPPLRAGVQVRAAVSSGPSSPAALLLVLTTIPAYLQLGSEFMPPLNEGSLLYMPTTLPGISVDGGPATPANEGPAAAGFPRGGAGVRQGGPRGDLDRSRAVLDDGNHDRAQAANQWRTKARWYSNWARFPPSRSSGTSGPTDRLG